MKETVKAIIDKIEKFNLDRCIVAIDGRCASGKSTLAKELSDKLDCSVVYMDDFFLRPEQRTEKRLSEAGGNIDYERFLDEIVKPVKRGMDFSYRPFDCHLLGFKEAVKVDLKSVILIEGSYSCHPKFDDIYDLKIFLDVDKQKQLERIEKRNGKNQLSIFQSRWIPLEEKYFEEFHIKEKCNMCFELDF